MTGVHAFLMGQCHVGLAGKPGSWVMVDAGFPGSFSAFWRVLRRIGAEPREIRAIVVTHFHYDHVGCLSQIRELSGAEVIGHAAEAESMRRGEMIVPVGTNRFSRAIARLMGGRTGTRKWSDPVEPTIVINGEFDLSRFGAAGRVIPTPGHTRGSVSVILETGDALIGDAATNMPLVNRKTVFPPFAEEPERLHQTWKNLLATGARTFHPAHGGPFDRNKLEASIAAFPWNRAVACPSENKKGRNS